MTLRRIKSKSAAGYLMSLIILGGMYNNFIYCQCHYEKTVLLPNTLSTESVTKVTEKYRRIVTESHKDIIHENGKLRVVSNENSSSYDVVDPNKPLQGGLKLPDPGFQLGALSNQSNLTLIIGIPTVKREGADYLVDTLESLMGRNEPDGVNIKIVVFIGETNLTLVEEKSNQLYERFKSQFDDGNVQVISPPEDYYPNWKATIYHSFDDPLDRVLWRSKQNLDQIFLMMYVYKRSSLYYLMMEDDIEASNGYLKKILLEAEKRREDDWLYLSFCRLGAIGKLFRTSTLSSFSTYLYALWNKKPLDWLMVDYARSAFCRNDEDEPKCREILYVKTPVITPSVFQHKGKESFKKLKTTLSKKSLYQDHETGTGLENGKKLLVALMKIRPPKVCDVEDEYRKSSKLLLRSLTLNVAY